MRLRHDQHSRTTGARTMSENEELLQDLRELVEEWEQEFEEMIHNNPEYDRGIASGRKRCVKNLQQVIEDYE